MKEAHYHYAIHPCLVPPPGVEPRWTNYLLLTGYKSAVLPLNYRGEFGGELGSRTLWPYFYDLRISNPLHYHPARSPNWWKRWDSNSRTHLWVGSFQDCCNKPGSATLPINHIETHCLVPKTYRQAVKVVCFYMAAHQGFEPRNVGIKIRCLRPTWRMSYK